jgi:hypothetical protein
LTPCSVRGRSGLVSCRLRFWGFPSRGFSFAAPGAPLGVPVPLGILSSSTRYRVQHSATHNDGLVPRATRLRGSVRRVPNAGCDGLQGFERRQKFVRPACNLSVAWLEPLLSWVSTLQGTPLTGHDMANAMSPLMHFNRGVQAIRGLCSRVSMNRRVGWSLARLPTLMRFLSLSRLLRAFQHPLSRCPGSSISQKALPVAGSLIRQHRPAIGFCRSALAS